jgi:hypothetical protein
VKNNKKLHFEKASKKQVVIFGASLLIFALVACVSFNHFTNNQFANITQVFGAQARNSLVAVKVLSWNESQPANISSTKRVSVNTKLTNLQSTVLQVAPGFQFSVLDATGNAYPFTAGYLPANTPVGGPLTPSQSSTYVLDFDVPNNAQIKKLKFQTDSDSQAVYVEL